MRAGHQQHWCAAPSNTINRRLCQLGLERDFAKFGSKSANGGRWPRLSGFLASHDLVTTATSCPAGGLGIAYVPVLWRE